MFHPHVKLQPTVSLTEGPIGKALASFAMPILLGQLLQQLYNLADAWVVGKFACNEAFAAVTSVGSITFFVIGFFNGIGIGGGVVISRYFGAGDDENVRKSIHTNLLFGVIASVLATVVGLLLGKPVLQWMKTPKEVTPYALTYFSIYFGGVSTVILYNICMSVMRAVGDSLHPLYYLIFSSVVNVALDLLFVAGFHWDVAGVAWGTVISQGLSVALCLRRMTRDPNPVTRLSFRELKLDKSLMAEVMKQGLPTGVQNSVISIGNMVIQGNINSFGAFAMSGHGAYAKIEGVVFLPITALSMSLPTFVSQNLGAGKYDRAKRGAFWGTAVGVLIAEAIGVLFFLLAPWAIRFFVDSEKAVEFGTIHAQIVAFFFCLLAFSHCAAGVLRGCGKAFIPMVTMLAFWCGVRILYVTIATRFFPVYATVAWAYPLTWTLSSIVFLICLLRFDWTRA